MSYLTRKALAKDAKDTKDTKDISAFLVEYQVAAKRADFHTQLIWTWAATIVGLNAAAIGILAQADKYSEGRFALVSLLAAAASFLVWWWNLAADRWHVVIRVMYVRLQEIELQLGMQQNRYIELRDSSDRDSQHTDAQIQERKVHLREATRYDAAVGIIGLKDLRFLMYFAVSAIWVLVVLFEAVAFVTAGRPWLLLLQATDCMELDSLSRSALTLWGAGLLPFLATELGLRIYCRMRTATILEKRHSARPLRGAQGSTK